MFFRAVPFGRGIMRVVDFTDRYASGLADLYNRSDRAWPGGLVHGVPKTADQVREARGRFANLGEYAALEDGKVVGFVRLLEWWSSQDATYVSWLNVDPDYQRRGIGRALLVRCIERTVELGLPRIDLHTWPGNDLAIPLYKRTGFKWTPGSSVYMQNYVPLVLRNAATRDFFERHDWYRTLRVSPKSVEDDEKLDGAAGYRYAWKGKGESLVAWIDSRARDVMAVDRDEYRVSFRVPHGTLIASERGPVEWKVRNTGKRPLSVSIRGLPATKVEFQASEAATVPPKAAKVFRAEAVASALLREPPEDLASHALASEVTIDGRAHVLRASFVPAPVVSFTLEPADVVLPPMQRRDVKIRVANNAQRSVSGTVRLHAKGLILSKKEFPLRLGKGGRRSLIVRVDNPSAAPRVEALELSWAGGGGPLAEESLPVPCLSPGASVAYIHKDEAVLISPRLRVVVSRYGGGLEVHDRAARERIVDWLHHALGPPFLPSALDKVWWDVSIPDPAVTEVVLRGEDPSGLRVTATATLRGDASLELRREIANPGTEARRTTVWLSMRPSFEEAWLAFATKSGPVRAPILFGEFPEGRADMTDKRFLAEGWLHAGSPRTGFGLAWSTTDIDEVSAMQWTLPALVSTGVEVPAHGSTRLAPVHLIAPSSDWRQARDLWRHLNGKDPDSSPARRLVEVSLSPSVAVAGYGSRVRVANERGKPLEGTLGIEASRPIEARPASVRLPPTDWQHPFTATVRFRGSRPGLFSGKVRVGSSRGTLERDFPILVPRGSVRVVRRGPEFLLDNGVLRARVAPGFAGSMHSLQWRGREVLHSSYPKAGSFSWMRPYHGGILPYAVGKGWTGKLHLERFRASRVEHGPWKGVALEATAAKSDLPKGLRVRVEYTMAPGVSPLATALTVRNPTRDDVEIRAGVSAFLAPGGLDTTAEFDLGGWMSWAPKHTSVDAWTDRGPILIHREGRAPIVAVVAAGDPLVVSDFGVAGRHVFLERPVLLSPGGVRRFVLFTIPCATRSEAEAAAVLSGVSPDDFVPSGRG